MKNTRKIFGKVRVAIDVSFAAANCDYGTVHIPVGTDVEQVIATTTSHVSGRTSENKSEWFVRFPEKVAPAQAIINGKPMHMFLHDAKYRGITVPESNITKDA
jgi:hypothetical protein